MNWMRQVVTSDCNDELFSVVDIYNKKKYYVTDEVEFLKQTNNNNDYLAEKPSFHTPVIVDFDIKEEEKIFTDYDESTVKTIALAYTTALNELLLSPPDEYHIFLLEKPCVVDQGIKKHGFHLHFLNVSISTDNFSLLYSCVQNKLRPLGYEKNNDKIVNKLWLLYGASKSPTSLPYKVSRYINITTEGYFTCDDFTKILIGNTIYGIQITKSNVENLLRMILSIRLNGKNNFSLQDIYEFPEEQNKSDSDSEYEKIYDKHYSKETIANLVLSLNPSRAEEYDSWIKVGMILAKFDDDTDFYKSLFHIFSKQSSKYQDYSCELKWNSLRNISDIKLGVGTLFHMLKEDGIDSSNILFNVSHLSVFDYDIASEVKKIIPDLFISHSTLGCFKYKESIWYEVTDPKNIFKKYIKEWSEDYLPLIKEKIYENSEENKDIIKIYTKILYKVKNYNSLNNVAKSLGELYFDENAELLFEQKRNLPFKNCVFDVDNWKLIEPNPYDYHTIRIEHDLIPWDTVAEDKKQFVYDFWEKIFPDSELRNYVLNSIARFFTGCNHFKQFQFWVGCGNNGKSLTISLLENIFGGFAKKIPKSLIRPCFSHQGETNPELARLKDARIATVVELTKNDMMDPGQIKSLTGNDTLYARDTYEKGKNVKEVIPMFFPIMFTNENPILRNPDGPTWDRIRLINFESTFTNDKIGYLKKNPQADPHKVFNVDPNIPRLVKVNAKYFLSYFFYILFNYKTFAEFNKKEIIPAKVGQGLETFKMQQNIIKQFLDENYIVDGTSTDTIPLQKILKDYNSSKPKVVLSKEELSAALQNYSPEVIVNVSENVRGLVKILW
nr:MAG: ATPase [Diabrotica toursvirus 3a]